VQEPNSHEVSIRDHFQTKFKLQDQKHINVREKHQLGR